ncbi:prepilin-type N-terminal cleavage/methylation domain-containing protein [Acinetobacter bereziniae]|uniref:prepilin-type N-terminal cleavage/methylation domain-containing protein n=1 Tax=Acinetobacter bereziniae TaxID=106648 RepID=UPI000C2CB362|nr:prepilin-type N-terminal cleavage/methylation domain-containing protein [Acinetobacter bereziniae]ATZ65345.1 prepilin-type N-terminal cleavage/methylation domain-containing protein [Acinetobacter bereziniae]
MKKNSGFSLIEIIIAVAIIGILVTISFSAYNNYTRKAKQNACLSETKAYANSVFYVIFVSEANTFPNSPKSSACEVITDASSWNESTTNLVIEAKSKNSSTVDIRCDLSKGANCTIIP